MADFLTRMAERTLGVLPVVHPIISSRYASESMGANTQTGPMALDAASDFGMIEESFGKQLPGRGQAIAPTMDEPVRVAPSIVDISSRAGIVGRGQATPPTMDKLGQVPASRGEIPPIGEGPGRGQAVAPTMDDYRQASPSTMSSPEAHPLQEGNEEDYVSPSTPQELFTSSEKFSSERSQAHIVAPLEPHSGASSGGLLDSPAQGIQRRPSQEPSLRAGARSEIETSDSQLMGKQDSVAFFLSPSRQEPSLRAGTMVEGEAQGIEREMGLGQREGGHGGNLHVGLGQAGEIGQREGLEVGREARQVEEIGQRGALGQRGEVEIGGGSEQAGGMRQAAGTGQRGGSGQRGEMEQRGESGRAGVLGQRRGVEVGGGSRQAQPLLGVDVAGLVPERSSMSPSLPSTFSPGTEAIQGNAPGDRKAAELLVPGGEAGQNVGAQLIAPTHPTSNPVVPTSGTLEHAMPAPKTAGVTLSNAEMPTHATPASETLSVIVQVADAPDPVVPIVSMAQPMTLLVPHSQQATQTERIGLTPKERHAQAERTGLTPKEKHLAAPLQEADSTPTIRVTIGRIDVRAVPSTSPAPSSAPKPNTSRPDLSLDDYLKRRNGGQR